VYVAYRTWEGENRKAPGVGAPMFYGQQAYYPPPVVMIPAYDTGYFQAPVHNIVQDDEVVEYMCGKCGNIIQNPVIQNVITCEKCGEKEYTGLK